MNDTYNCYLAYDQHNNSTHLTSVTSYFYQWDVSKIVNIDKQTSFLPSI